jgi:hypothetical protein
MKQRLTPLCLSAVLAVVASITGAAFAQEEDTLPARPMYGHLKPNLRNDIKTPATPLTTWNGSFVFSGTTYNYNMVGTAPSTGTATTTPVFFIPVKMVYKTRTGTTTFDPATHKLSNGQTVEANTLASPIFQSGIDFTSNGVDLGTTQYIDAFQRGNFWGTISSHTGYHILLGTPTVLPELTLNVGSHGHLATEFGVHVGLADINWFDLQLQAYMTAHTQIVPNSLPIFLTYDVYLTQGGGCCIGGYHNSFGSVSAPQAYSHATYIDKSGAFSQNVSALSHEVGEWADDPLVVNTGGNPVACGILEVGDPEEGFANFGSFPYTLGGFTYDLQDLTFLPYFGAPTSTSAGGSLTFQGNPFGLTVCSNGG